MTTDIYIYAKELGDIERSEKDVTALPPGASLIAETDWAELCKAAGGEEELIKQLEVIDARIDDGNERLP